MDNHDITDGEVRADDLTWREQDILMLLAERLTNREIAKSLHLAESTVKDYVGKILRKLYVKNRRQAVERAKELGLLDRSQKSAASPPTNLRVAPTPFIGRKDELEQIKQHLGETRLLTLTGPGGMGKTRLAVQAAMEAAHEFTDGRFFVSLAPLRSVDHIIQTIAEAVNFPLASHENPQHQLLRYLQKKQLLLVMDNFEHLLEGVSIVSEILQNAPTVKILATSREKLNLQSETNLSIGGMDTLLEASPKDREQNDSTILFMQSASKILPGFDPSPGELIQIINICQLVQGMPLAIELAASWLHVLSVDEIAEELEKGLDILATEVRDTPKRHRSIRAVFDYSWSLLDQTEKEIFKPISVFRAGFTREAAQEVAGASLSSISGLVNKSFLSHDQISGRFRVHELLRQYAQEKLEEIPQARISVKEAHAAYYAEFMHNRWELLKDNRQILALEEIEADIENVRAAWRFYLTQKDAPQMLKFIHSFWLVYWVRGWNHAAVELFGNAHKALSDGQADLVAESVGAIAMANQGFFMAWLGLAEQGYILAKESVEILEHRNDHYGLIFACHSLSLATYYINRPAEEKEAAQKVLEAARKTDDKWLLAFALYLSSMAAFRVKDFNKAKQFSEASLKLGEELGEEIVSAWPLTALGQLALIHGDLTKAKEYYLRCLLKSQEIGFRWAIGNAIKYLGRVALLEGDVAEAQKYFGQSLWIAHEIGLDRDIANHLIEFARLRVAQDRSAEGTELLVLLLLQPASQQARLDEGRIKDSAKKLLDELEANLPPKIYAAALERGESVDLDEVILELVGSNKK